MTGYSKGENAGKFGVGMTLTRAELANILWRNAEPAAAEAYDASTSINETDMADVASGEWYTGAANWAVSNHVINGVGGVSFEPYTTVSVEMFATVIANYCASSDRDATSAYYLWNFLDGWTTSDWAQQSIAWASKMGLINGYDRGNYRELCPHEDICRERAATILKSAFDKGVLTEAKSDNASGSSDPEPTPTPDTSEPDPLTLSSSAGNPASIKSGYWNTVFTNNSVKSAVSSNSDTMSCSIANDTTVRICGKNAGSATLTVTDTNGSVATLVVNVTKPSTSGDKTFTATRYDSSLAAPTFTRLEMSKYTSRTNMMWLEWHDTATSYDGYEVWYSTSPDFGDLGLQVYANSYKPSDGKNYTNFTVGLGNTYYVKIRAFTCDDDTQVVGNWSEVKQIDSFNYYAEKSGKAQYSYEIYNLNSSFSTLYSGERIPVYVKTEAPDASWVRIIDSDGKSLLNGGSASSGWGEHEGYYDDIYYATSDDALSDLRKVEGGYVGVLKLSDGQQSIRLVEDSKDGYVVASTLNLNVLNYTTEKEAWMQSVLNECTTSSMTSFEKMAAVCKYLKGDLGFRYLTNDGSYLTYLASQPNTPFFVSHRWDSATSPSVLCDFANLIGGFDDVHNCYGDYKRGTAEWQAYHYMCRVTIGDDVRYYEACPTSDTGVVSTQMIDFSDTSSMTKLG